LKILEQLKDEVKNLMGNDPAHDYEHVIRVFNNAKKLALKENANEKLVLSAALLHDVVSYPKYDKRSNTSADKSAKLAEKILKKHKFSKGEITTISDAIRSHSFSKHKKPSTLEGQILQDADRLDALGAIGIARVFSVGGYEKRHIYNNLDPFCFNRKPNDKKWTLDHFYKKLLLLEKNMNTKSAKIEATKRTTILKNYLEDLKREIQP